MSDDKTVTGMKIMSEFATTRGRAAAQAAGFRTEPEIQAFVAGANWFWEQQKTFKTVVFPDGSLPPDADPATPPTKMFPDAK